MINVNTLLPYYNVKLNLTLFANEKLSPGGRALLALAGELDKPISLWKVAEVAETAGQIHEGATGVAQQVVDALAGYVKGWFQEVSAATVLNVDGLRLDSRLVLEFLRQVADAQYGTQHAIEHSNRGDHVLSLQVFDQVTELRPEFREDPRFNSARGVLRDYARVAASEKYNVGTQ